MMHIGMFGGTFNPPHRGHTALAQSAVERLGLDLLLVFPAGEPPHKQVAGKVSAAERLEMARLAFRGLAKTEVSDWEVARDGKSYTVDTVHMLRAKYPQAQLHLLLGSDMLRIFERWYAWREIAANCRIAVYPRREGDRIFAAEKAARLSALPGVWIECLDIPPVEISSTDLRENPDGCYLDPAVRDYILRKGLYGG